MILNKDRENNLRLFVGKELEGPWAGINTLFVGGTVDYSAISAAIKTRNHVLHIYWGANFVTPIDVYTVLQISRDFSGYKHTFEISNWNGFFEVLDDTPDAFQEVLKTSCLMVRIQEKGSPVQTNLDVFKSFYAKNHKCVWLKYENETGVFTTPLASPGVFAEWKEYDTDEDIL